jgi:ferric-dicitrate binding protein FerR (iron transport regulator)
LISLKQFQQDKTKLKSEYSRYIVGKIRKLYRLSVLYKIAAILALPLAFTIFWQFMSESFRTTKVKDQICSISSPKGHISKCILPDGSNVWINTGSTVWYNATNFNIKNREVYLEGEAYFDVKSKSNKPFKVITDFADINVTGTSFNVNAYRGSIKFETVLAKGKVNLQFKFGSINSFDMHPGQRAILDINDFSLDVQSVDSEIFTSWRNGELLFKDAKLSELIAELERMHDVRFYLKDDKIGELRFRGMFSYNNNLIEALEKIKRTSGIEYYIKDKEVWLKK